MPANGSSTTPRKTAPRKVTSTRTPAGDRAKTGPTPTRDEAQNKYAPTSWGSSGIGKIEDLTVPSGQTCAVRRPGIEGLMRAGILNNVDSLTALVESEHIARASGEKKDVSAETVTELMNNPKKFDEMIHLIDRVICHVVVQPPLHMTPGDVTRREDDKIYCDMVGLDDKMFIFNFAVGGTRDLERFRQERDGALERLGVVEGVGSTSE